MDEKNAYLNISSRAIEAAEKLCDENLQENSAFFSYHSFESAGGALCAHNGNRYPRGHNRKINQFIRTATGYGLGHSVAVVATILNSIGRNSLLYPNELPTRDFQVPQNILSVTNARDLLRRVRGIKNRIENTI